MLSLGRRDQSTAHYYWDRADTEGGQRDDNLRWCKAHFEASLTVKGDFCFTEDFSKVGPRHPRYFCRNRTIIISYVCRDETTRNCALASHTCLNHQLIWTKLLARALSLALVSSQSRVRFRKQMFVVGSHVPIHPVRLGG